ncbi:YtpI family protein [Pradoshia sp.]
MPILVFFIVTSLSFYIYYKAKTFRTPHPMQRACLKGKSSMTLGLFVLTFGINQLFLYQTPLTYIIAGIFIIMGALSIYGGFKMYRHFSPLAEDEFHALTK